MLSWFVLLLNEEYSFKLLPVCIQITHVWLLCECRSTLKAAGISAVKTKRPAEGVWGEWGTTWISDRRVRSWLELSVLLSGRKSGRRTGREGGPQRALLSSLQGLYSTELICCEMCKCCLDWCLVCIGDWEEEWGWWSWSVEGVCGEAM